MMIKKQVKEILFRKEYEQYLSVGNDFSSFPYSDLPKRLLGADRISFNWDPPRSVLEIYRYRPETDEERAERLGKKELYEEAQKKSRYAQYMELKKEFELEPEDINKQINNNERI